MNPEREKLTTLLARIADPQGAPLTPQERQWLDEIHARYPFFAMPMQHGTPSAADALTAPSGEALARMSGNPEVSRFDDFYPQEHSNTTPTTTAAIDDFLNTFGHQSAEEDALLERLIFNPVPDYAQQLARQEEHSLPDDTEGDSRDARLNRFILSHRQPKAPSQPLSQEAAPQQSAQADLSLASAARRPSPRVAAPQEAAPRVAAASDGLLSMSLAKIYIKTRRYEAAYEILSDLSLRVPGKSAYFADQLRFLRKLIINQRHLDGDSNTRKQ